MLQLQIQSSNENNNSTQTTKIDFSNDTLLTEVNVAAKEELATVVNSKDALNTVLDTSITAIKNVNEKNRYS